MRAAIITAPGEVEQGEWPDPEAGAEARSWSGSGVQRSTGATAGCSTIPPGRGFEVPALMGSDAAGVIEAVGNGVDGIEVGEEVVLLADVGWGDAEDRHPALTSRSSTAPAPS